MSTKRKSSDLETMEVYRVALTSAEKDPQISKILEDHGYDAETIKEGLNILSETRAMYDTSISLKDQRFNARKDFDTKRESLAKIFDEVRKKAQVVFRKDAVATDLLMLNGAPPAAYVKWIQMMRKFYTEVSADSNLQEKLSRLKITSEEISEGLLKVVELEESRTIYLTVRAKSQDATEKKDQGILKMYDWMLDFYKVAKIAYKNEPQLLEAAGKVVRR